MLAITHSALQAFNPAALINVYKRSGALFLVAPGWLLASTLTGTALAPLPMWAGIFFVLFMVFSIASLTGALLAPARLADDVYIAEPLEADEKQIASDLQKFREGVLAHAYGFISRDNREGGFRHIFAEIEKDPDPAAAWAWYFDRMLRWESRLHGLLFGQHYVHDALTHGEETIALKVTMRCRYEDPGFKPLAGDRAALLAAAERSGNGELVEVLRKG